MLRLLDAALTTGLAAALLTGISAIGVAALPNTADDGNVTLPAAILIGSGISAFVLAVFAWLGFVALGVWLWVGTMAVLAFAERRSLLHAIRALLNSFSFLGRDRLTLSALGICGLSMWILSVSPPRSADAMRYHLAHIRQIVEDGRWSAIADYTYALPFGWSLLYLPFEMIGLPQGSQLLSAFLLPVILGGLFQVIDAHRHGNAAPLVAAAFFLHPFIIHAFSEASADPYALLCVVAILMLLARLPDLTQREATLFGFVSWIGIQSRYQMVGVGLAATLVFIVESRRFASRSRLAAYARGSGAALVLASPFYLVNLAAFRNPVWPLLIGVLKPARTYADLIGMTFSRALAGNFTAAEIADATWRLFTAPHLFPLPLVIVAAVAFAVISRKNDLRVHGWFASVFIFVWIAAQPRLYPRFILLMLPVASAIAAALTGSFVFGRSGRLQLLRRVSRITLIILASISLVVAADSFRYVATGDLAAYHRFTWFYPVFDWANRATPRDARFLVIVSSGQTYYLDRAYRRADPWLSGVVDWRSIESGESLAAGLDRGGYSFVIYEDRDWSEFAGGAAMTDAVLEAVETGRLKTVARFDEPLYTSRMRRRFRMTHVLVFERPSPLTPAIPHAVKFRDD